MRRERKKFEASINVTPLVDVMLVLLIVFMVASPMMTSGVKVDLPKAGTPPLTMDTKPITITLKNDGGLYIGEDSVPNDSLLDQLRSQAGSDMKRRIFVRADARIDYGKVMDLMGRITSAGFSHVALLAQQTQQ